MINWEVEYTLTSPEGTLLFNTPTTSSFGSGTGYLFALDPEKCNATPGPLRLQVDPVPQADGSIIHPAFKNGMTVKLGVQFWVSRGEGADSKDPACGEDLRVMWDEFLLHMNALYNPSVGELYGGQCRWTYEPPGTVDRMLDHIRVVDWPVSAYSSPLTVADFSLGSDLAYEIDAAESENDTITGTPTAFVNEGTNESFPVFRVTAGGSPLTYFGILNGTTGQLIEYDSTLPGAEEIDAGDYVEIITFRNTVYLNGNSANRKSGINVLGSDFFALQPGTNMLSYSAAGGTCEILWNSAWAG